MTYNATAASSLLSAMDDPATNMSGSSGVVGDAAVMSEPPPPLEFCGYWNGSVEATVGACSFWMEGILITITGKIGAK